MCGILFSTSPLIPEREFALALDSMAYRGPDASGLLRCGNVLIGQRRLSIIDPLPRSDQPFLSEDGRYAVVFNGEIYNYKELAKRHMLDVTTGSDTEVLLRLFIKIGSSFLSELNGMFAFVILDTQTGAWFVARDRLGVKPLYVAHHGSGLLFASEPAPLLELTGRREFDETGLRQYRKLRTFFNGVTIWKGIGQFPAGCCMTQADSGVPRTWWKLPEGPQSPPSDEELHALIMDAVQLRRIADVPVGAFLSGGLDSTIVTGIAAQRDTWSVGFATENEFDWAKLAADKFGTSHNEVTVGYEEFITLATEMIRARREPLSVPNEVLIFAMTKQASKKNKVILSGEGADELFYGYDRIFRWAVTHQWDLRSFSSLYSYGSIDDFEIVESALSPFLNSGGSLQIVARFFQIAHLHGLLRRLDSATMLCGVEAREPFVDYRLIERLVGVSFDWKLSDGQIKAPLKRVFADLVPKEIIDRPKIGFAVPLERIAFPHTQNQADMNPMDRWFAFNLSILANQELSLEDIRCV